MIEVVRIARSSWKDYLGLMKPRVISLLLLTCLATMIVASEGLPPIRTIIWTMIGGFLSAGAAGALNCYFDRDTDAIMHHTLNRPLPDGRLDPQQAYHFGIWLGIVSTIILWLGTNFLVAILAILGIFTYVVVYTQWLKRRSPQNIVVGGIAGGIPVLIGWASITQSLNLLAFLLFLIVVFWTPAHFWALTLIHKREYSRASLPVLPVIQGNKPTRIMLAHYSLAAVAVSLIPVFLNLMKELYGFVAVCLGAILLGLAYRLIPNPGVKPTLLYYRYSLAYLALLFITMTADHFLM